MTAPNRTQTPSRPALLGGTPIRAPENYLVFGRPHLLETDIQEAVATLRSGWIGTGPKVKRLETDLAAYLGIPHAVAVASCTAALRLAMQAMDLKAGDEVITTPLTFCATANAVLHAGAVPVLADCRRDSMNLDPEQVERKITPRTRGIIPVHFAGRLCDMDALARLAEKHNLFILEDCAHAIETTGKDGRHAGAYGRMGAFSFYATKNITTAEGGAVVTQDKAIADRIRILALHGLSKDAWRRYSDQGYQHYDIVELGYKCNLTDLHASLAIHQLERIEASLVRREEIWRRYDDAFAGLPVETPRAVEPGTRHARHLYTLIVDETRGPARDKVLSALHAEGIGAGVHYLPLSRYAFYQETLGVRFGDFPNAEAIGMNTLSLPLSPGMTDEDVEDVIQAIRRIIEWPAW